MVYLFQLEKGITVLLNYILSVQMCMYMYMKFLLLSYESCEHFYLLRQSRIVHEGTF